MKHHPNGRLKNIIVFSTLAKYLCGALDGAVAKVPASHQCGAGANSGDDTMSEMSLFFILSLTLSGFSLVTPVFLCPQKPGMVHKEPLCVCGYATSKSLFIRILMQMLDLPVQLLVR